jgi:hypothetical protein
MNEALFILDLVPTSLPCTNSESVVTAALVIESEVQPDSEVPWVATRPPPNFVDTSPIPQRMIQGRLK